jgi:TupA-like ATPgrasp
MNKSIRIILRNNDLLVKIYDSLKSFYYKYCISDKKFLTTRFKKRLGREVNLDNPIRYNDKLQWLKINWYDAQAAKCADKYEVREFITEKIGEEYLNDIYGVYDSVEEIDIDTLPKSFVLKGTHGSGFNIVCKDKNKMDWDKEFKKMRRWLATNYYLQNKEWVYRDLKPRIICEKFIEQGSGEELRDYRIFCFNGEPKFITVDFSITDKSKTRRNLYDLNWNLMDKEISYPRELDMVVSKPKKLDEMLDLSRKISSTFPHARVDFYYINNKIIFGEITFFHQSGMGTVTPIGFENTMGDWLKLPV